MSAAALVRCGCCGRPVPDNAYVCPGCASGLHEHLVRVTAGGLADELDTALARQTKLGGGGGGGGGRSDEQPLAFGYAASEAIWVLRSTLVGWVRALEGDAVRPIGPICRTACPHGSCRLIARRDVPADTLPDMAGWLAYRVETLRHLPEGPGAVDELVAAIVNAEAVVWPSGDHVYVGPCAGQLDGGAPCGADLYAPPGAAQVTCRACGATYRVHQRRQWLLEEAEDVLGTATEIARAVTNLGRPVTPERIRQWAHRGCLLARGRTARAPLYRVGDVLDLAAGVLPVPAGPACEQCAHASCRTIRERR
ncbi:hypothetical protein AB0J37_01940 [Microbispora rosea]|uniref:hypothetical protein n=1 Tax=Microbispora rosea TaxID=58117 RepID=UPI00342545BA